MKPKSPRALVIVLLLMSSFITFAFGVNAVRHYKLQQSNSLNIQAKTKAQTLSWGWNPLALIAPVAPPVVVASGTAPTGAPGGFGIEGDLLANSPTSGVSDWVSNGAGSGTGVLNPSGLPINTMTTYSSLSASPGELFNDGADEAFTNGSKVNDNPNTAWNWTTMKVLAKDDIHRGFFATSIAGNGHTWVEVAADRRATNGTSYLDFEFLQNTLSRNSNGTFFSAGPNGGRTVGDLLVTLELTGGGGIANFIVQRWQAVGAGFDYVDFIPDAGTFFSSANAAIVSVPFGAFGNTTYDPNQFAEAAFDLTALLPTLNPCIGIKTVLIKTKASASNSAVLKDFISPFQVNLGTNPQANAGADLALCQTTPGPTAFTVNGIVTNGTPSWTVVSTTGGATANILSPGTASTGVNVTGVGTVTLRLTTTSAACGTATDDVVLTVNAGAVAQIQPDVTTLTRCQTGSLPTVFSLTGIVSGGSATPLWTVLPGGTATAVIATPNAATTDVTVTGTGFVDIRLTSTVSCGTATDTIRLTVNPSPTADAGVDQTLCQTVPGPTVFTVNGTPTNGTPSWSVLSTTGGATATIVSSGTASTNVNVTGTGTVTLGFVSSSANGCGTASDEVILTVNPTPVAPVISGNLSFCTGGSSTLTASGTGTFMWFMNGAILGETSSQLVVTAAGSYTAKVTNAAGCPSPVSLAAVVVVNPIPATPTISGTLSFCEGSSSTLTASGSGTYMWFKDTILIPGQSSSTLVVTTAGSYTVKVTSAAGCDSPVSLAAVVTVNPIPAPPIISNNGPLCVGSALNLSGPTVAGATYSWTGPNGYTSALEDPTIPSVTAADAGTYSLTITTNGCTSPAGTTTVVVNPIPATPTISGTLSFCEGGNTTLNASGTGTYIWFKDNVLIPGQTTSSLVVNLAGSYTVKVTSAAGCDSPVSLAAVVTVNPIPTPPTISGNLSFCAGDNSTLTASGSGIYMWFKDTVLIPGQTASTLVVTMAGNYTVKVTSTVGCPSAVSGAATVVVNPIPATPVISGNLSFCTGGSSILTATGTGTFMWFKDTVVIPGQTTSSLTVNAAGSYTVKVTSAGCPSTLSAPAVVTVNPIPATPTISGTLTFCETGSTTLTASGTGTFMWFKDTVVIPGQTAATLVVTTAGSYTVKVTSAAGCPSLVSAPSVVTTNLCADLVVTKSNGVTSLTENTSTIYTLTLVNNGPSAANGTKLSDPAVTGLTKTAVGSCTALNGAVCPVAGSAAGQLNVANLEAGTVIVPTLPNGGSISFTVTATVTASTGTVTNTFTAILPPNISDPTPPATASDTDPVDPPPVTHNPVNPAISDQKAGSFLVFPYYNSKAGADTRMTISNTGDRTVTMHMFFLDSSCSQADQFVCLTPNASQTFLASEYDPENTGYLLAVAVSDSLASWDVEPGCPVPYNGLIGNAFVREGNYNDTYGAEAFWAHGSARDIARCDTTNWIATLNFNGSCNDGGYDYQPIQHVAEIQSPNDSVGQRIIVVGLRGTVGAIGGGVVEGAAQQGIGVAYNDGEKAASYSSPFGSGCQRSFTITPSTPRVPGGLGSLIGVNNPALIPSGRSGTLKWNTTGSVGLILTPSQGTNKWSGIRTLHKTMVSKTNTLMIPILPTPGC